MAWVSSFSPSLPLPPHSLGHSHTHGPLHWEWCLSLREAHTSLLGEGIKQMVSGDRGLSLRMAGRYLGGTLRFAWPATFCLSSDGLRDLARPSLPLCLLMESVFTRWNICTAELLSVKSTQGLLAAFSKGGYGKHQYREKMS